MTSIRECVWLKSSADVVWQTVGDPTKIHQWAPSIQSSAMEGALRTLVLRRGGTIVEEIITLDQVLRRIQYAVRQGLPVESHLGTVDVIEAGVERCLVVYSTDVKPDAIADAIRFAVRESIRVLGETFGAAESQ